MVVTAVTESSTLSPVPTAEGCAVGSDQAEPSQCCTWAWRTRFGEVPVSKSPTAHASMEEMAETELSSLLAFVPAFAAVTTFHWSLHAGAVRALCGMRPECVTACGAGRTESRSAAGARLLPAACGAANAPAEPIDKLNAATEAMA